MLAKYAKVKRYQQRIEHKIGSSILIRRRCVQNSIEMGVDQWMYQMLKKVKDFGVIFGASGKGIIEKQNS